ncbi:het domain-containing protein [Triangularia verruculosa]|uniref:Het domain-containing protein n=1 Tax=Triangularia verruculosa TaxID=2587418 RepID=A0AAN6XGZ6_9PEZI|nr:het domain-containing protein [Triangularia verruculosa]
MRLINVFTLELHEFHGDKIPAYAISHTWGDDEVTFQNWNDLKAASRKLGFSKIKGACAQAEKDGLKWLWCDTNCIDKTSSAELSEAINSMFSWYLRSAVCYAYLSDVPHQAVRKHKTYSAFGGSRWFTRGWTLQELIAPRKLTFFAHDWTKLGDKHGPLIGEIALVTGVPRGVLTGDNPIQNISISRKMSWLSKRTTTRVEDMAYCMMGLFGINMPLLYGEGPKAFTRLQGEIIKSSNDHTIFCWTSPEYFKTSEWSSMLAPSPSAFKDGGNFFQIDQTFWSEDQLKTTEFSIYSMTNAGLSIRLPLLFTSCGLLAVLNVQVYHTVPNSTSLRPRPISIPLIG